MTWEELISKGRHWSREARSHSALVERGVARMAQDDTDPTPWETTGLLQELALGLSDLHEACQTLLTGLDALAIAMRGDMTEEDPKIH